MSKLAKVPEKRNVATQIPRMARLSLPQKPEAFAERFVGIRQDWHC